MISLGHMTLPAPRSLTMHELGTWTVPGLMKVRIEGHQELPREGPLLLLVNRCSLLDPWLLTLAAGRPVQMGARSPLFSVPGLGELASRFHTVPLLGVEDGGSAARGFADALEQQRPAAIFAPYQLERRVEGERYALPPAFLDVLLATRSERIPVVPLLNRGFGWQLRLQHNPILAPLLAVGAAVFDPAWPPVVYAENVLRIGRPVLWRDGDGATTLHDFRGQVEDSLGALF